MAKTLTLSKREIFMAFMVAESTNMGGPSSNTSLMNSLPWRKRTEGESEKTLLLLHGLKYVQLVFTQHSTSTGRMPIPTQLLNNYLLSHPQAPVILQFGDKRVNQND